MQNEKKLFATPFYALLFLLFLGIRFYMLDADLPPWSLTYYQALDEPYYMLFGYNHHVFGTVTPKIADFVVHNYSGLGSLIVNFFPWIGIETLGNNYYGIRTPSIVMSLVIVGTMIYLSRELFKNAGANDKTAKSAIAFLIVYTAIDFSFIMAGRVLEPTIYRAAAMMLLIFFTYRIFKKETISDKDSLWLGALTLSSFVFVYLSNFFLLPAIFTALCIRLYPSGWSAMIRGVSFFILGTLIAFVIFNLLFYMVFHIDFFTSVINVIRIYSDRLAGSGGGESHFFKNILANIFSFFATNFFRFNLAILLLFLATIPLVAIRWSKSRDHLLLVAGSALFFFFLQSLVLNDFPYRKLIILFPLVFLFFIYMAANLKHVMEDSKMLRKNRAWQLYALLSFVLASLILYRSGYKALSFDPFVQKIVTIIGILILLGFASLMFKPEKIGIRGFTFLMILSLVPNIALDYRYIFQAPQKHLTSTEMSLRKTLGDQPVLGGMAWSLKPNNDYIPLINTYAYLYQANEETYIEHTQRLQKMYDVQYALDFTKEKNIKLLEKAGFRLVQVYDINEAIGRPIGLYRFERKKEEKSSYPNETPSRKSP